jgi:hypothetical protein
VLRAATAAVADPVTGRPSETRLLSQVGVSAGATTGGDALNKDAIAGRLTLDAAKLADQLTAHFGDTKALFTNVSSSYDTEGLAQWLGGLLDSWVKSDGILDGRIDAEQTTIVRGRSARPTWTFASPHARRHSAPSSPRWRPHSAGRSRRAATSPHSSPG